MEIIEILGVKDQEILTRSLYEFKETGQEDGKIKGYLEKKNELENIKKLQMAGRVAEYETQVITWNGGKHGLFSFAGRSSFLSIL